MLGHSVLIHTRQLPISPTTNSNPPPLLATPQKGFFREILGPKFEIHCKKNLISENPNYWMLVGSALLWRQNKRKKLMWVVLTQPLFSPPVFWSKNEKKLTKILSTKRSVVQTHFLEQKLGAWAHIQPNKNILFGWMRSSMAGTNRADEKRPVKETSKCSRVPVYTAISNF